MPKNQGVYLYFTLKTKKKRIPSFFNFHSLLWKPDKSAPVSHEKSDIFRICLWYKLNQLSWVIFISHYSQKSWKEKFREFFQLFAFSFKVEKSRLFPAPFSAFSFGPLDWQLSKNGGKFWAIVALIYKCFIFVVAHFLLRQCLKPSDV